MATGIAHINMYNILTNRIRALIRAGWGGHILFLAGHKTKCDRARK